ARALRGAGGEEDVIAADTEEMPDRELAHRGVSHAEQQQSSGAFDDNRVAHDAADDIGSPPDQSHRSCFAAIDAVFVEARALRKVLGDDGMIVPRPDEVVAVD